MLEWVYRGFSSYLAKQRINILPLKAKATAATATVVGWDVSGGGSRNTKLGLSLLPLTIRVWKVSVVGVAPFWKSIVPKNCYTFLGQIW